MWARRLSHQLMMAGPIALLIAIGVNGRTPPPMIDEVQFGADAHARLLKFVRPVGIVEDICTRSKPPSSAQLKDATEQWIALLDEKKPVTPVDIDVPTQNTVLGEICDAKQSLIFALEQEARKSKDPETASRLLTQSLLVADVNKYSDFGAVQQFAFIQAKTAEELNQLAPFLSERAQRETFEQLSRLDTNHGRLQSIATHLKEMHSLSLSKRGQADVSIALADTYGQFVQAMGEPGPNSAQVLRNITQDRSTPTPLITASTMARLAMRAEGKYKSSLEVLKQSLQFVKNSKSPLRSTVNVPSLARDFKGSTPSRVQLISAPVSVAPSLTGVR
ncbi:MAG: hypothetical protein JSS66_13050 [Armatimonadetes bacterium]|nr:hypothetical protein [Armatimonadota bacterium]